MSTSDPTGFNPFAASPELGDELLVPTSADVPGLPTLAELTSMANAFFQALPTDGASPVPSSSPGVVPSTPAMGTGPRVPANYAPPPASAVTATNPGPPQVSPLPVPAAPTLAPLAPPIAATAAVPGSQPALPNSPAPMPHLEHYAQIPLTLGATMGFVADLPLTQQEVPSALPTASAPARPSAPVFDERLAVFHQPLDLSRPESTRFQPLLVPQFDRTPVYLDSNSVKSDFPILRERVNGRPLIWLDNAATTQKPQAVIDRLSYFYEHENSNIHRAAHTLAARATDAYEGAREKVRSFINAGSTDEIIFVRGTTEGINLIAQSWGRQNIGEGDEIIVTHLEHHANIVPWQQLCASTGAILRVAPVDDTGQIIIDAYAKLFSSRTKLVSFTQVSNALGTVTPAGEMIDIAHRRGVPVLLDAAQSVSHMRTDVQLLDVDFLVFSGHKIYGPTGIGVVYGKKHILDSMPPWQGGGNMIADVTFEQTVYQDPPARFEAGTGNIADAVGLGAALDYLTSKGVELVAQHEHALLVQATEGLCSIPGVCIIGTADHKAGVISFVLDGWRTEDVGAALDREGIAVRSGHHCAQPILRRFGVETTVRPSFAIYNTGDDVEALVAAVRRLGTGTQQI